MTQKIKNKDFSRECKQPLMWVVAGSDCSGGAGIQADNAVAKAFGVKSANVITAITAQHSHGVDDLNVVSEEVFESQWNALEKDGSPQVIKTGMLASQSIVDLLASKLNSIAAAGIELVVDPVLKATAGGELTQTAIDLRKLLANTTFLTPNHYEFKALFADEIENEDSLEQSAKKIASRYQLSLVITGGDSVEQGMCSDLCCIHGEVFWMHSPRIDTPHLHGTGCSFASAVAASLALGYSHYEAAVLAKTYLNQGFAQPATSGLEYAEFLHTQFPSKLEHLPAISREKEAINTKFPSCDSKSLGPYPVVDSVEWIEKCLKAGIKTLQLRVKNKTEAELDLMIAEAVALGKQYQARLFINDYWQLAIKHQAYGVHLGQEDLDDADLEAICAAGLHLGVSTHSWYEIARAHSLNPSYIAIGPVYATTTKEMPFAPQGLEQLNQWLAFIGDAYPVVAIGGIDLNNVGEVMETGVGSVAMVRAVTEAKDYEAAIAAFFSYFEAI